MTSQCTFKSLKAISAVIDKVQEGVAKEGEAMSPELTFSIGVLIGSVFPCVSALEKIAHLNHYSDQLPNAAVSIARETLGYED